MTDELQLLRIRFENKDYAYVKNFIQTHKNPQFENILNDEDAEVVALASFSFFNLGDFKNTLRFTSKLIKYIEDQSQVREARELYENLIILVIDSLISLGKRMEAYFFLRRKRKNVIAEFKDIELRYDKLIDAIASDFVRVLYYLFPTISIVVVIVQNSMTVFSSLSYMIIIVVLVVLIFLTWQGEDILTKFIRRLL